MLGTRNVYDGVEIPPRKENALFGNRNEMRGLRVGRLNLQTHYKTDVNHELNGVCVTEGTSFNIFSLHEAQARQTITFDKCGAHLFETFLP